ncbi:MAG: MATE family efflux transporter [Alphaproteobacteria bacterium]|nr:MATE family efflux transporter [Alphaproteobacteria bacterium]
MSTSPIDATKALGTAPIGRLLFTYATPGVINMLVYMGYMLADRYFIGRYVGADALAAFSVATPLVLVMVALNMFIGIGGAAVFSIRLGEKAEAEAERVLNNSIFMAGIIAVVFFTSVWLFAEPILRFCGASENVLPLASVYIRIFAVGAFFDFIGNSLQGFLRASGFPAKSMAIVMFIMFLNIFLDWLLIAKLGMGIRGAAIGTAICMVISAVLLWSHFLNRTRSIRIRLSAMRLSTARVLKIMEFGQPALLLHLSYMLTNYLINVMSARYGGDAAISAFSIVNILIMFVGMPMLGITQQGMKPIVGYNFGAKNNDRVIAVMRLAMNASLVWSIICTAVMLIWPREIIGLFIDAGTYPDAAAYASRMLFIFALLRPLYALIYTTKIGLGSTGRNVAATVLNLSQQVVFLTPLLIILPSYFGIDGISYALVAADALCGVVSYLFWRSLLRGLRK